MTTENEMTKSFSKFAKLFCLSLLTGTLSGISGALFSKCISLVTDMRSQNGWLIYFLPIAGIFIVFIYNRLKVADIGTNQVIKNCTSEENLSPLITPAIFISSAISHLFGASVGREGAALQLGGGLTSLLSRVFHLNNSQKQILAYCGMAGLFSAVFGTPLAACTFALQIVFVWKIRWTATMPTLISSYTAYFIAISLGAHPERFPFNEVTDISILTLLKATVTSVLSALLAVFFCHSLKWSEKAFKKLFKNAYLRIVVGGVITVFLTLLVKTNDYNGAGVNIIENIFIDGEFKPEAFFVKLIFTCIAVASGYKGGEIIPTLFIGATFGSLIATLIGLPITLGAVIGMTALFCGVTNCPIAAIILSVEIFSGNGLIYVVLASLISFFFSGNISLYSSQKPYKLTEIIHIQKKNNKNT